MDQIVPHDEEVLQEESAERRIAFLRARIVATPERVGMRIRLAHVLEECGRTDEALATLRQAVASAPGHRRAANELKAFTERSGPAAPPEAAETKLREPESTALPVEHALLIPSPSPEPAIPPEAPSLAQLLALPELVDFGWQDPGGDEGLPPEEPELAIRPASRLWHPSAEFTAGLAIVVTIGIIGALSRLHPHTLLLAPPAHVTFLPQAPSVPPSQPDVAVVLPAATLASPAQRVAVDALRADLPAVEVTYEAARPAGPGAAAPTVPLPPLPDAAPLDVTVAYRGIDLDGAARAGQAAARLMRDGGALRVTGRSAAQPGGAGVFYYFDEDGQGARAVASLLGNDAGPVLRLPRGGAARRPGEILVVLPHGETLQPHTERISDVPTSPPRADARRGLGRHDRRGPRTSARSH